MNEDVNVTKTSVVRGRGRPRKYDYPKELKCTVTGKMVKTNPIQFERSLKDSGKTMEEYVSSYISREGRGLLKGKIEKKAITTPDVVAEVPTTPPENPKDDDSDSEEDGNESSDEDHPQGEIRRDIFNKIINIPIKQLNDYVENVN